MLFHFEKELECQRELILFQGIILLCSERDYKGLIPLVFRKALILTIKIVLAIIYCCSRYEDFDLRRHIKSPNERVKMLIFCSF